MRVFASWFGRCWWSLVDMVECLPIFICRDHSLDQQHICILQEEELQEWFQFGIHGQAIYQGWRVDPYELLNSGSTSLMERFPLVHCFSWLFNCLMWPRIFWHMLAQRCARYLLRLWHRTQLVGSGRRWLKQWRR